ncbi:MAG: amino acid permease [Ignavibacteriales bacterium]|nr:amino acid permease [Ignavibacteriales bacterium]
MFTESFFVLAAVNVALIGGFAYLLTRKNLLAYFSGGRWWLTWLSIAIITLMDELTSIFYAPSEAFRVIGHNAIVYLAITSVLMRVLSTRMTEIAEILELHGVRGGGVYSFSYLVLGPTISFIAIASILVDYILTASISTVSAVQNGLAFYPMSAAGMLGIELTIVWAVAGLNILGIKENAKITFAIFIVAAIVLMNLLAAGMLHMSPAHWHTVGKSFHGAASALDNGTWADAYYLIVISIASCILAYSGIESVVQTAGFVKSWHDVRKAYVFLGVTIGIFTPLLGMLVLSQNIDFKLHETDLITHFADLIGGINFGFIVGILASVLLMMAVNTAFVASSELLERVAHRYGFNWVIKTNRRQSLYRIHIFSAIFYSFIIIVTGGNQTMLAEMYALGLIASFTINMGSLLIYRYSKGTKDVRAYNTSRIGTLILFVIFLSCFLYLAYHKPYGTALWGTVTLIFLGIGLKVAQKRAPEIGVIKQTDAPLNMIIYIAEKEAEKVDIYFRRPQETNIDQDSASVFISIYSPRQGIPDKLAPNHFRFANKSQTLYDSFVELLYALDYELPDKKITVHFGWPLSSWIDRLAIGVMVFSIMRLPKLFPRFRFVIEYLGRPEETKGIENPPILSPPPKSRTSGK